MKIFVIYKRNIIFARNFNLLRLVTFLDLLAFELFDGGTLWNVVNDLMLVIPRTKVVTFIDFSFIFSVLYQY